MPLVKDARPITVPSMSTLVAPKEGWRVRHDPIDGRMVALYRAATPEEKLAVVSRLNGGLQEIKAAEIAASQPEWDAGRQRAELRKWWLGTE
jgi:hypothetical protein